MTMRGGLMIATGAVRPRFAYARAVNPLWLAEIRNLLTTDGPARTPAATGTSDSVERPLDASAVRSSSGARALRPAESPAR